MIRNALLASTLLTCCKVAVAATPVPVVTTSLGTTLQVGGTTAGFVPDPGLKALYLLNECVGSTATPATVVDATGNYSFAPPSTNPAVCSADGALNFTLGTTGYMTEPAGLQLPAGGTVEMIIGNSVQLVALGAGVYPQLFGYTGVDPALAVGLRTNYAGIGYQGFGTKWIAYQERSGGNSLAQVGSLTSSALDNGLHVIGTVWTAAGVVTIYLDGVVVPQFGQSGAAWTALNGTGGQWQWGGASNGTSNCAANSGYCNFGGKIYGVSFSTTQATASTEVNNYKAWMALATNKGAVSSPYYGVMNAPGVLIGMGESWAWGHGLSNSNQAFTYMAASYLGAAQASGGLGQAITAQVDGNDNNTGYNVSGDCVRELHAMAAPGTGLHLAVLMSHGNSAAAANVTDGSQGVSAQLGWPNVTTTVNAALQDVTAFTNCAKQEAADGYIVAVGGATSGLSTPSSYSADTKQKDTYNPVFREYAMANGILEADFANDPRIGADGAAASGTYGGGAAVNNCTLDTGGSAVPAYQTDGLHPSQCGHEILGHQLAAVLAYGMNTRYGAANIVSSSATANSQLINQAGDIIYLTGSSAGLTLLPVSGLAPGTVIATVVNAGSAADTVTMGTDYNGGPQNNVFGGSATTYSVPAGTTKKFVVGPVTDTTGISYVIPV